jgi:hypothetical protein
METTKTKQTLTNMLVRVIDIKGTKVRKRGIISHSVTKKKQKNKT